MPTVLDDKYILGKTLGSGVSCKVKLAKDQATGTKRFAIKLLKSDDAIIPLIKTEVDTLLKLGTHPNIVNLLDKNRGMIT